MANGSIGAIPLSALASIGAIQTIVAAPPVVANQTCEFGDSTLITAGAYQLVNTGGGVDTIGAVTGTASTQYTAAVVADEIVLTAKVASPTAGTVIIADVTGLDATNIGSVTVTVSVIADSYSVSDMNEAEGAAELAALAFSDIIYFRDGDYNIARTDVDRFGRAVALTGTWDGSNYVEFKPHDGATAVDIYRLQVDGSTIKNSYFHFTKSDDGLTTLNFKGITDGVWGGSTAGMINGINSASFIKISECTFAGDDTILPSTASDAPSGIYFAGGTGGGNNIIMNNTIHATYEGIITTQANNDDFTVNSNTFTEIWNDCISFTPSNDISIVNNTFFNKKYGDGGIHGDYMQGNFSTATTDIERLTITDNIAYRGDGTAGQPDGQFIFLASNTTDNVDAVIERNFGLIEFNRGISIQRPKDCLINNNTVVSDNPDVAASVVLIIDDGSSQGGNTVSNNVSNAAISGFAGIGDSKTNNIAVTDSEAQYDLNFAAPVYGASVTDPATEYAALASGPLDVSPPVGAFALSVYEPFITMGIGPSATVDSFVLMGFEVNPAVGGNGWLNRNYFWDNL